MNQNPIISIEPETPDVSIEIKVSNEGKPGYTPQRGIDYWTDADKKEIVDDVKQEIGELQGGGTVKSVNGKSPDKNGNVVVDPELPSAWDIPSSDPLDPMPYDKVLGTDFGDDGEPKWVLQKPPSAEAVRYTTQTLNANQQAQARKNIGAQPAGDYALKSEIPSVAVRSVNGKTGDVVLTADDVGAAKKEDIDRLSEEIEAVKETIGTTEMEWVDVSEVTSGAFINGLQTSPFYTIVNTPDYAYAVAVVDHSRKYRVTCSAPVGPRMIAMFRDENGVKIGDVKHPTTDQQIVYYENLEIEVPSGAYDIVVTSYTGSNTAYVSCQPVIEEFREVGENDGNSLADYEIEQLARRITQAEKANDFAWGAFDKAYFVFVHDDTNSFLSTAYNAFHAENTPMSAATVASLIERVYDGQTAKQWLDAMVADGGEVLMHYNADLLNNSTDDLWRTHVVEPKRVLEGEGFEVRGLILANNSDAYSAKGEKFCRRYYDYADKVGTSTRYKLGRTLMLSFASLDVFKAHLDTCAQTPGLYAFGFHGLRADEAWITEASLREIIQYINAKSNTEITTYGAVFDAIGTTVLEKRIAALESAN